ncbi:c-type cytochrome [Sphingomonas faeni]|uniref:c-type cytochrome n=1 Tax=Sphingomonas faeni TaxID=185950 RepID=UPI0020C81E13|nr:c-type cytochrome [Sphingomonas faeni]MCP8891019.1 c-type cytochrome [Sphingomonas faeni]
MKPPRILARAATPRRLIWIIPLFILIVAVVSHGLRERAIAADVLRADPEAILGDPTLREAALAAGHPVYQQHCASCHGATGKGDRTLGVPDLTDDDHLYREGTVAQIEDIARYGIRAGNKHGWNLAVMPAYASKNPDAAEPLPPQTPAQIEVLTQFIHSFTAGVKDHATQQRGRDAYNKAGCWDCHGRDLGGDGAIGAPSLTDDIWLYGGTPADIRRSISRGRAGMSPAFARKLTPAQLRNVAVYVASLAPTQPDRK